LFAGCSSATKPDLRRLELSKEEEAIFQVGRAYNDATKALKKPPGSIKELKPYLKKYGDPDEVLISPNDGQPYQISWGMMAMRPPKSRQDGLLLVYEKTGKDGKRYGLDFRLHVFQMTDAQFEMARGLK
jgi:hypothetical protein